MPRRAAVKPPPTSSRGPAMPLVYAVLFVVLGASLVFNVYLFVNTKEHVHASRQEELVEEQVFQRLSADKKEAIVQQKAKEYRAKKRLGQDINDAAKDQSQKPSKLRKPKLDGEGSDSRSKQSTTAHPQALKDRSAELLTDEVKKLNARFARRVALSYTLDAMASFSHSFYAVGPNAKRLCLDRGEATNTMVAIYECHPDDHEFYMGAQAWQLSTNGDFFTPEVGSIAYGQTEPLHTKLSDDKRCLAFFPMKETLHDASGVEGPVLGRLLLVNCEEPNSQFRTKWMYDIPAQKLVNTAVATQHLCLQLTDHSKSGIFNLMDCSHSSSSLVWTRKRLHKPKSESLTDNLHLQDFAFNSTKSAEIGYYRDIGDMRSSGCQARSAALRQQVSKMPKVTVILCFYNEEWFALLRSVWGVIMTSPEELVDEILLIDDGSTMQHLGPMLDEYLASLPFLKTRVVRAGKRIGLIQARLLGAKSSKSSPGRVLIFLDSHIEPVIGWMEPLVASIAEDHRRVLTPVIPSIGWGDLSIQGLGSNSLGIFDWDLVFRWESRQTLYDSRDLVHVGLEAPSRQAPAHTPDTEPYDSPTMAGGLFAIDKQYFYDIGSYDEEMTYWGAENLEISFRIWMCGGILQIDPCSDVFHIFREAIGHQNTRAGSYLTINNARLAKVWLDEFQDLYFGSHTIPDDVDIGDISDRVALRDRLQCKSFKWYLDNFMPDMFIPDDEHTQGRGEVRNPKSGLCLDTMGASEKKPAGTQELGLYTCHGQGGHQNFYLTLRGELRVGNGICVDAYKKSGADHFSLFMDGCHGMQGNQHWIAMPAKGGEGAVMLKHASNRCLEANDRKLMLENACDVGNEAMVWHWSHFDYQKIESVNH